MALLVEIPAESRQDPKITGPLVERARNETRGRGAEILANVRLAAAPGATKTAATPNQNDLQAKRKAYAYELRGKPGMTDDKIKAEVLRKYPGK